MDCRQLKNIVIVPALTALGLNSPSAVNLLLGTAAVESQMGKYIAQIRIGLKGGIGIYQCEKATYDDLWTRLIAPSASFRAKIKLLLGYEGKPPAERMSSDLMLATVMARLKYYSINEKLPDKDDIMALGKYWKTYYNTHLGGGSVKEFTDAYVIYVAKTFE